MIKVLADKNLYKIADYLPKESQLTIYDPADGLPDPVGYDALIVQTVTKLNSVTLPEPPEQLKFIGTGSSGTDHIQADYFAAKGIKVCNAKGCNAAAVSEYILTSLLLWSEAVSEDLSNCSVGVIGAGSAGSAVMNLLEKFGISYKAYDPPKENRDPHFQSVSLHDVLSCDILTFHVPLTVNGEYKTYHWLNERKLSGRNFKLIINASRGGVIDEKALLKAHKEGLVENYVIDVWENEPVFNDLFAEHAFIATPHIAGYSEQSKLRATEMICQHLSDLFKLDFSNNHPSESFRLISVNGRDSLSDVITAINPVKDYDAALRELKARKDKGLAFRELRNNFPFRYEYPHIKVASDVFQRFPLLQKFGIKNN